MIASLALAACAAFCILVASGVAATIAEARSKSLDPVASGGKAGCVVALVLITAAIVLI